jgi:hypothetical protein
LRLEKLNRTVDDLLYQVASSKAQVSISDRPEVPAQKYGNC